MTTRKGNARTRKEGKARAPQALAPAPGPRDLAGSQLAAILESSREAMIGTSLDGTVFSWNPAAERVFGYTAEEMAGNSIRVLIPSDLALDTRLLDERLKKGERIEDYETSRLTKSGDRISVSLTLAPVRGPGREILGCSTIAVDITARRLSERRRAAERAVTEILRASSTVQEAAVRLLRALGESLRWRAGVFWLVDPQEAVLRAEALWHMPLVEMSEFEAVTRRTALRSGAGVPGHVWAVGRPAWFPNFSADPLLRRSPAAARAGLHAALAFPVTQGDVVLGVFEFFALEGRPPDPDLLSVLGSIGSQVGQFLDRQRAEDTVRRLTASLECNVAERTAQLEEALRELGVLAYTIAHDLRAPLRAMAGFSQVLVEDYVDRPLDEVGRDCARRILSGSQRMDRLIQDLLAYSEVSRMEFSLEPVDLDAVAGKVVDRMASHFESRKAHVVLEAPIGRARGNRGLLIQVLENLLSNAVKFVEPGVLPSARIRGERRGDAVRVWVEDNGIGIASEHHPRIFRIFERLNPAEAYPGTGIGLAIVRRAMERIGGRAGVESETGKGSRFWIELRAV